MRRARTCQRESVAGAGCLYQRDEIIAQLPPLEGDALDPGFKQQIDPDLERSACNDRRGTRKKTADTGRRNVPVFEFERARVPVPPGNRIQCTMVVALRDVQKGRSARTSVQKLVAATDREIRLHAVEVDAHGAGAVT